MLSAGSPARSLPTHVRPDVAERAELVARRAEAEGTRRRTRPVRPRFTSARSSPRVRPRRAATLSERCARSTRATAAFRTHCASRHAYVASRRWSPRTCATGATRRRFAASLRARAGYASQVMTFFDSLAPRTAAELGAAPASGRRAVDGLSARRTRLRELDAARCILRTAPARTGGSRRSPRDPLSTATPPARAPRSNRSSRPRTRAERQRPASSAPSPCSAIPTARRAATRRTAIAGRPRRPAAEVAYTLGVIASEGGRGDGRARVPRRARRRSVPRSRARAPRAACARGRTRERRRGGDSRGAGPRPPDRADLERVLAGPGVS